MTYLWTKDSGPGDVTFSAATSLITDATFSAAGMYVLRLTVTNGIATGFAQVVITVLNMCAVPNADPVVEEINT